MQGKRAGGEEANGLLRVGGEVAPTSANDERRSAERHEEADGWGARGQSVYIGHGVRRHQPVTSGRAGAREVWRQ